MKLKSLWAGLLASLIISPAFGQVTLEKAVTENTLRPAEDVMRDGHRKPLDILKFWGIPSSAQVADLGAGAGYYTRILSAYLDTGHVTAVNSDFLVKHPKLKSRIEAIEALAKSQKNVTHISGPFDALKLPHNLDGALFVNFYHDTVWLGYNRDKMNRQIFNALKPGGTYLLIDHQAPTGTGVSLNKTQHRIEGEQVIHEVLKAGFHLVKTSPLLLNPKDILTQSAVKPNERRGKTSRFVYLFQKP